MSKVVPLVASLPMRVPVQRVIDAAASECTDVVVIGWQADGSLYVASSDYKPSELVYLLELAKIEIISAMGPAARAIPAPEI